jgi:hypothetical protein
MSYPNRIEVDEQGNMTAIPVTNVWVLANKSPRLNLTTDKSTITANEDATDVATITVQLTTPILIDGNTTNLTDSIDVTIIIENKPIVVSLINGVSNQEIGAVFPKIIEIRGQSHESNVLEIEAI